MAIRSDPVQQGLLAGRDQQAHRVRQVAKGIELPVLPKIVQHQKHARVFQQPVKIFLGVTNAHIVRAHASDGPRELMQFLQSRGLAAEGQPDNAIRKSRADVRVMAERRGQHRLAQAPHAIEPSMAGLTDNTRGLDTIEQERFGSGKLIGAVLIALRHSRDAGIYRAGQRDRWP